MGRITTGSYSESALSTSAGTTTRDRWDSMRCDVMLVNVIGAERISVGTCIELGWADAARVPIVLAMDEGNVHDHLIVRGVAGYVVTTLDEAINVVLGLLLP